MKLRVKSDETEIELEVSEGMEAVKYDTDKIIKVVSELCEKVISIESARIKNSTKVEP